MKVDADINALKIAAIILITAGILGLAYGGFSYTKETSEIKVGALELTVNEKKRVNFPIGFGVAAIVIGGALLVYGSAKRG